MLQYLIDGCTISVVNVATGYDLDDQGTFHSHVIFFYSGLCGYWHCCHSWPIVPASGDSEDDCGEADGM
jgi:hypothetical protein